MDVNVGELIRDRYKIKKKLGNGNWGITYLAIDLQAENSDDAECVVKEIKPSENLTLEENKYYFHQEVKALQSLGKHSQIPSLIDSFIEQEYFYIVQEFIAGTLLNQKIKPGKRLIEQEAQLLLINLLKIVQFIHQNQHVHRDLKPDNIIQRDNGEIVIIDFGTVKEINTLNQTNSGDTLSRVIGAPPYIAPERFTFPRPQEVDKNPRVDIYSLGIIGLQAITGLAPNYLYIDPHNDGARLWSDAIPISPRMKNILNRMAHPQPNYRYQSVDEVLQDLKALDDKKEPIPTTSRVKFFGIGLTGLIVGALLMKIVPTPLTLLFIPKTQDYPINFTEVCNSPIIKGQEFKNHQGTPEHITLKYTNPIWSVFRWKCIFTYQDDTQIRGINLNDYCTVTYKESEYKYEAYFKNYLDKNSWYCTNVGTKLKPKINNQ
ncbi:putative Calcium/calmodulin-dependent protein kinase [Hyella patelloides LEGE 07179]|uniref:Putative Calcium/calmodulin-dependent protein kinase n=1 Tax=Hyella patelloides LEGE 07179 TaxID=945734 RepID=A0A563W1K0_9CYAN|nr:serine/threonine-protein kinase [Hyella patelloides]VEP17584.1 putative Calcium/calmodulin-dependent protein kinase [Hyella patelloides LEGE 07179]